MGLVLLELVCGVHKMERIMGWDDGPGQLVAEHVSERDRGAWTLLHIGVRVISSRPDPYLRSPTQLSVVYFSHYTLLGCVYTHRHVLGVYTCMYTCVSSHVWRVDVFSPPFIFPECRSSSFFSPGVVVSERDRGAWTLHRGTWTLLHIGVRAAVRPCTPTFTECCPMSGPVWGSFPRNFYSEFRILIPSRTLAHAIAYASSARPPC